MLALGSDPRHRPREWSRWLIHGLPPLIAALAWLGAGSAEAAEWSPLVIDATISEQGCSGMLGLRLDFDSMLFETQAPRGGFRTFDFAFLAVVALIVISAIRFRHATARHRLELARRMVEKGIEPPPELLGSTAGSDLRRGVVLVFTGVGLLVASLLGGSGGLSPAGLIPGFIGVGYLVSHRFAARERGRS